MKTLSKFKTSLALCFLIEALCVSVSARASSEFFGSVEKGNARFMACMGCHGEKGQSSNGMWPNLSGQKREYLVKQLEDFAADRRKDPLMGPMAKTLSTEDVRDISAYLSSLKGTGESNP